MRRAKRRYLESKGIGLRPDDRILRWIDSFRSRLHSVALKAHHAAIADRPPPIQWRPLDEIVGPELAAEIRSSIRTVSISGTIVE